MEYTMIDRTEIEYPYGVAQPVRNYSVKFGCGCVVHTKCAAQTIPEGAVYGCAYDCPRCYTGPSFTYDLD